MKKISLLLSLLLLSSGIWAQLSGNFSVSASKQVRFSKGLLRYHCANKTWTIASNQYDVIGASNSNVSSTYSGYIDLFGWGTSGYNGCMPYETSLSATYGGGGSSIAATNYDWGIQNFDNYRTLTQAEWSYLFSSRANASALRAPATVNNVCGWILLPDNWSKPSSVTFTSFADGAKSYTANVYTVSQFSTMQSAGAVFLPAAGYRYSSGSVSNVSSVNSMGYYWSADYANVSFMGNYLYCTSAEMQKYMGLAVRLVYDTSMPQPQYTITTAVSPAGTGTVTGAGTYYKNSNVTIKATPADGWVFDHFERSYDNATYSSSASWTFTVKQSGSVTAYFKQKAYYVYGRVSSSCEGKGTVSPEYASGVVGTTYSFTATAMPGCRFVRWEDGVTTATHTYTITGNEPTYLYALFESVATYTLTVRANNSSYGTVTGSGEYEAGEYIRMEAIPNKGYKVTGWDNNPRWANSMQRSIRLYGDSTCTAYFAPASQIAISVNAEPAEAGIVSGGGNYYEQEEVTLSAKPNSGYKFIRWEQYNTALKKWASLGMSNPYTLRVEKNESFRAVFEECKVVTVNITSSDEEQGTIRVTPQKNTYYERDTITVEAIPASCYKFYRWSDGNTSNPRTFILSQNLSINAQFKQSTSSVSFLALYGKVRIVETEEDFAYEAQYTGCTGDVITVEAMPTSEGFFFDHWSDGNTDNPRTYVLTEGTLIRAEFNKIEFGGYCGFSNGSQPSEKAWWTYDWFYNIRIEGEGNLFNFGYQTVEIDGVSKRVSAASWYSRLKSGSYTLTIDDKITNIPSDAFCGCLGLKRVNLKNSAITSIGYMAFAFNSNLEEIIFPDSLQTLANESFHETGIRELIFPEKLTEINSGPFQFCNSIKRIIFKNPVPITPFRQVNWWGISTDTIYVPSGTRQAYIDAGYTSSSYIKHVIEWHKLQVTVNGIGTCTADTTTFIAAGDSVQLTIVPGEGQKLWSLEVKDEQGNNVFVDENYAFIMPESNVHVYATFADQFQGIENVQNDDVQCTKLFRNGQLYILRGQKIYTVTGAEVSIGF